MDEITLACITFAIIFYAINFALVWLVLGVLYDKYEEKWSKNKIMKRLRDLATEEVEEDEEEK